MALAEACLLPLKFSDQVRAQSKRAESELEEVRQNTVRIETEKAELEERVEVEGAERVTVVASVTHERDFLLRQASVFAASDCFIVNFLEDYDKHML